ncbi:polysaccharide biosynthesis/export family protein [Mastigocladopsis repens]|uniref:polysaccharide biosynthesis/export family protein n=1 Tax=Mastigocladopsis repens TaxID=221287 RepID=UPI0002D8744E|nr:polysaccharide biosynthesis/export family protein [Mastigocladopsis repens]
MRVFNALSSAGLHVGVVLVTIVQPVVAQIPNREQPPQKTPALPSTPKEQLPLIRPPAPPPGSADFVAPGAQEGMSPQLNRYLLGPGDVVNVLVQRPPGRYLLGPGDAIAVSVLRFPDLSFQTVINPEGNIAVPLLGTLSLQGLSLEQAQEKIRSGFNRFVVDPIVTLSLVGQRPEFNFSAQINPEGNIVVPQVGTVSLQGLTLEEAQEKIRLGLSRVSVDPVVSVSLTGQRPVQVTISGEVNRPGIYPVGSATPRVSDALFLAGGSAMMADLRQVQVRRKLVDGSVVSQTVDLYTPLQNGGEIPNLRLQDGDAVIVPRRELANDDSYDRTLVARSTLATPQIRIRVLNYAGGGIVTVPLPNGSTFIDVLTGINTESANLSEIALVRFDPERGRAVKQVLNAKKALAGDVSQNVPLQDNDVIVVGRNLIAKITNLLSTITRPFFNVRSFLEFFDLYDD